MAGGKESGLKQRYLNSNLIFFYHSTKNSTPVDSWRTKYNRKKNTTKSPDFSLASFLMVCCNVLSLLRSVCTCVKKCGFLWNYFLFLLNFKVMKFISLLFYLPFICFEIASTLDLQLPFFITVISFCRAYKLISYDIFHGSGRTWSRTGGKPYLRLRLQLRPRQTRCSRWAGKFP